MWLLPRGDVCGFGVGDGGAVVSPGFKGSGGGLRGAAFTELRVSGVLGAVLVVRFWWLALRFLSTTLMARGLCRMLQCFWLLPRGGVCGVGASGAVVSRGFGGRAGRPAGSRVHRASGLSRGPRGRAGGEVLVAGCTVSVDKADGEGSVPCHKSVPDAAVLLAATA